MQEQNRFCRWCKTQVERRQINWFGRYLDVHGRQLHYVEAGSGEPLILVHGLVAWSYVWRKNLAPLAQQNRVLALDLPGFGLSERSGATYSLDDQAEAVLGFMDAMGIKQAVLCGHSMGGEVCLRIALRAPDRVKALVLVSSTGCFTVELRARDRLLTRWPWLTGPLVRLFLLNRRFVRKNMEAVYHDTSRIEPHEIEGYYLPARAPGTATAFVRMVQGLDWGKCADRYGAVTHPCLLIWGDQDRIVPINFGKHLHRELRHSRLAVLEDCGHSPPEEEPERFNQLVVEFLSELG